MNKKALIIDGDPLSSGFVRDVAGKRGFAADVVESTRKAVAAVTANAYAFYFIAVDAELEDGLFLVSLLNDLRDKPRIIVMSSSLNLETETRIREKGVTYILKKPFTEEEVASIIGS